MSPQSATADPSKQAPRKRSAPKHLLDGSNGEAPSAAHQSIVNQTQARLDAAGAIAILIKAIEDLSAFLPPTVAEGTEEDEIHRVLTNIHGHDDEAMMDSTFNRRLDCLFKEDVKCRDANGRLHLIRRGELGMLMVVRYLRDIRWNAPEMNLEGAKAKLERVVKEMEFLSGTTRADARKAAPRRKPKQKTKPAKDVPSLSPADVAKEARYDQLFDAIMPGVRNGNSNYRPKKPNANLSEEEDDDFVDEENEPTASDPKKRKIFVVDGVPAVPPPKSKKPKTKSALAAPPPTIEVIDVDVESEDENLRTGGKRGPKSESRDHYWPPVATTKTGGNKRWSFTCRHCKIAITFKRTVGKTQLFGDQNPAPNLGNLSTHLKQQHDGVPVPSDVRPGETRGISASSAKIMADFLVDGKLNPAINSTQKNFYKIFAAWIIEDDLAFTTGETPGIERLFAFMRARFLLPSDTTVRNTLASMFGEMYEVVKSDLAAVKSKIAVATDTWTTRAMTWTFAGSIASWITSDWELVERVIDFHPIEDKEHEGQYAAIGLAKCLNDYEALEKLFAVAADNASANDVLVRALSQILMQNFGIQFAPANSQIHCLAHVVNLVVQKLLAMLDDAPDPDVTDDYLPNKDLPLHYDPDEDPEVLAMEQEVFKDGEMGPDEDEAAGLLAGLTSTFESLSPLQKLRTTATKICSSPQCRKRFRDTAARVYENKLAPSGRKLASLMVVRDVRHRWNYTHAMIKRALLLKSAIKSWVVEREELASLNLNTTEWELLEKLGNLLEMFTNVTKQMSHSSTPTLPWVLPLYIGMRAHLRSSRDDSTLPASLRSAATAALEKLEGYFSKACDSQLNIISTLLHPSFGIKFFRKIESDTHLLSEARARVLFEHVYESYKRTHATDSSQPNAPVASRQRGTFGSFLDNICMVNVDVPEISPVAPMSEINRFWDAFANYDGDSNAPLLWWKTHESEFPIISKMARDFLAIPGTSVSVERLFSSARHLCHESRASLKPRTIQEAMLTKMWIKEGLLKTASLECGRG